MRYIKQKKRLMSPTEIKRVYQAACFNARHRAESPTAYFLQWNRQLWPTYHILVDCLDAVKTRSAYQRDAKAILRIHANAQRRFNDLMINQKIIDTYIWRYQRFRERFSYLRRIRLLLGLSV